MSLTLTILASSSEANCAIVRSQTTAVLVDAGLGRAACFQAMAEAGISPESLRAVLLSHQHGDHTRGAVQICSRLQIPLYCDADTAFKLKYVGEVVHLMEGIFSIGDLKISAFSVPHNVTCFGFWFAHGGRSICMATDLGNTDSAAPWMVGSDVVCIESNTDPDVLKASEYNSFLKQRITRDHLSNESCCELIRKLDDKTKIVVLSHVSERSNDAALAKAMARRALNGSKARLVLATEVIGEAL